MAKNCTKTYCVRTSGNPCSEAVFNTSWLALQTPTGTSPTALTAREQPARLARPAGRPCGDPSCPQRGSGGRRGCTHVSECRSR